MSDPTAQGQEAQPGKAVPDGGDREVRRRWTGEAAEQRYDVGTAIVPTRRTERRTERPAAARRAAPAPTAVFVVHGMGQQRPFETLDSVAEGLLREDEEQRREWLEQRSAHAGAPPARPQRRWRAVSVQVGDERLQRLELELRSWDPGHERQVHVYEGYWAPLPEGRVTLRDVIAFLFDAGLSGIARVGRDFQRWLFGDRRSFPIPVRTPIYLVVAMLVVLSLMAINATVAAATASLAKAQPWPKGGLFVDLTALFSGTILVLALFGLCLLIAASRPARPRLLLRHFLGWLSRLLFYASLLALTMTGAGIPLLIYRHTRSGGGGLEGDEPTSLLAGRLQLTTEQVNTFDRVVAACLLGLFVLFAVVLAARWVGRLLASLRRDLANRYFPSLLVFLLFVLMVAVLATEIYRLLRGRTDGAGWGAALLGVPWALLVVVTFAVRKFFIEYLGDVAAYVTAHKLDRFRKLRQEIKDCVYKAARAVYRISEYDEIAVVGHSLGSVVVYDTLNRLLLDDELAAAGGATEEEAQPLERLDVADRTRLLLTFGSPLDKVAYLVSLQGKETTEARDALVASQQPLIRDYRWRQLDWCNVFAPADIVSGWLKFYDWPQAAGARPIQNVEDPDATTWLLAHNEYWVNRTLFAILYRHVA